MDTAWTRSQLQSHRMKKLLIATIPYLVHGADAYQNKESLLQVPVQRNLGEIKKAIRMLRMYGLAIRREVRMEQRVTEDRNPKL